MLGTRRTAVFLISTLALAGVIALDRLEPDSYVGLRNLLRDTISRAGRTTAPNPQLVFLAIDSDSVGIEDGIDIENLYEVTDSASPEARALRLMSKHWPWPRDVYGMILDRLVQAGAKVVLFDLTFPTSTDGDEPFRLALEKYSNRVVIGSNFTSASAHAVSHTRPPDTLVPQTTPVDDRVAYTNFWPDDDDVVRRAQYRVTVEQANQTAPMADSERYLSLDARGMMKAGLGDRVPADLSAHVFRYTGPPRTGFPPHSIFEIFVPRFWKGNYHNGEFFRDKIVLVGAEGNWQHDEHSTPWGAMPGPELHLNAMNAAIQGEFIREVSHNVTALVALTAALLALGLSLWVRSPWVRVLCMIALDLADIWITLLAYNHFDVFIPCLPSLIPFNTIVLIGLISDFTFERVEKKRVRRALERYVSSNVVREMIDSPEAFEQSLGGVLKPAAVLFSDIRGYSTVSAQTHPQALVTQLNEYLSAMVECVFRYGGTLDKFIGDAVMAVWGNVRSEGAATDATNAVRAAMAMREELARLNQDWKKRGLPEFRVGIAIHYGEVVVGNIGSPHRMEFTVIGEVVNVSWKLQELTKEVNSDVVVSKAVADLVIEHFEVNALGEYPVRGSLKPFEIFRISQPVEVPEMRALETVE